MMIVSIPELQAALGLLDSITAGDLALLNLLQPKAQGVVIDYLGYSPEYARGTEYYPRDESMGRSLAAQGDGGRYEVSGGRAVYVNTGRAEYLQLQRLPVRAVHHVYVDYDARFGQRAGAFDASTEWTAGVDFYLEQEGDGFCLSGNLIASTGWPVTPGSVKVDYTAGYTADEFTGRASSGVNAAGLHDAIMMTTIVAFKQFKAQQKQARVGFVSGPVISERLGDYNYAIEPGSAAAMASMKIAIPDAAIQKLAGYLHYGLSLT